VTIDPAPGEVILFHRKKVSRIQHRPYGPTPHAGLEGVARGGLA
jgi:hypothetical protein